MHPPPSRRDAEALCSAVVGVRGPRSWAKRVLGKGAEEGRGLLRVPTRIALRPLAALSTRRVATEAKVVGCRSGTSVSVPGRGIPKRPPIARRGRRFEAGAVRRIITHVAVRNAVLVVAQTQCVVGGRNSPQTSDSELFDMAACVSRFTSTGVRTHTRAHNSALSRRYTHLVCAKARAGSSLSVTSHRTFLPGTTGSSPYYTLSFHGLTLHVHSRGLSVKHTKHLARIQYARFLDITVSLPIQKFLDAGTVPPLTPVSPHGGNRGKRVHCRHKKRGPSLLHLQPLAPPIHPKPPRTRMGHVHPRGLLITARREAITAGRDNCTTARPSLRDEKVLTSFCTCRQNRQRSCYPIGNWRLLCKWTGNTS